MADFKEFRRKNKLTQIQVARYFGCTQAFISLIERGESKLPKEYISKIKADSSLDSSMLIEDNYFDYNEEVGGVDKENMVIPANVWEKIEQLIETINSQQRIIEQLQKKRDSQAGSNTEAV